MALVTLVDYLHLNVDKGCTSWLLQVDLSAASKAVDRVVFLRRLEAEIEEVH